jgi:hypothetical protein
MPSKGSIGELNRARLLLLNPPYGPREMSAMIDSLEAIFRAESASLPPAHADGGTSTTALVVVPRLTPSGHLDPSSPHHARLASSPWLIGCAVLAPDEHAGFVDGRAHERNAPRRLARAMVARGAGGDPRGGGARQVWAGLRDFTISLFVLSMNGWELAERRRRAIAEDLNAGLVRGHQPGTESDSAHAAALSAARLLEGVCTAWRSSNEKVVSTPRPLSGV